jgi:hypothetical protein
LCTHLVFRRGDGGWAISRRGCGPQARYPQYYPMVFDEPDSALHAAETWRWHPIDR